MWMNIPVEAGSFEHHHDAARRLAGDLAAVICADLFRKRRSSAKMAASCSTAFCW
jgi:hypothetical protein